MVCLSVGPLFGICPRIESSIMIFKQKECRVRKTLDGKTGAEFGGPH